MITRKVGAGAGRRLPGGDQAGRADAAVGAGRGRARAARRHAGRRAQRDHRRRRNVDRDRQGAVRERRRAPPVVHRLHRGRPHPDAAVRADDQEARRSSSAAMRRSSSSTTPTSTARSKARWSASTATPARPASAPTGSTCRTASTTPSSPSWPTKAKAHQGRQRLRGRRQPGPADRRPGDRQGRGAMSPTRWPRARSVRDRRQRASASASTTPTVLADVTRRHAVRARRDLRPGGAGVPLQDRGRGDRAGQRHRVRPGELLLQPRHRPHLPRRPRRWSTAWSASTPA